MVAVLPVQCTIAAIRLRPMQCREGSGPLDRHQAGSLLGLGEDPRPPDHSHALWSLPQSLQAWPAATCQSAGGWSVIGFL
jgi:hypothetical protein